MTKTDELRNKIRKCISKWAKKNNFKGSIETKVSINYNTNEFKNLNEETETKPPTKCIECPDYNICAEIGACRHYEA